MRMRRKKHREERMDLCSSFIIKDILEYKDQFNNYAVKVISGKVSPSDPELEAFIIEINLNASILMVGATDNFSVTTTAIAAQTVIIGVTPDTFTNVEEYPGDEIADELFNFADLE